MAYPDSKKYTKRLVESALFISGKAMSAEDVSKATGIESVGQIKRMLKELEDDYRVSETSLCVSQVGNRYVMELKEPYASKVNGMADAADLSKSALRVLAYISRNEPIMQSKLVKIFGSATYQYMKELIKNDFVAASRYGRTKRISTTPRFLEYFNLKGSNS